MSKSTRVRRLGFLALSLTGCTRNVQVWPPPATSGTAVIVHFNDPRVIVFDNAGKPDSVAGVKELRGPVISLQHDTLVVRVLKERNVFGDTPRLTGREVSVLLDQSTALIASEADGWKFAYGLLAGAVLIFVGIVVSGS